MAFYNFFNTSLKRSMTSASQTSNIVLNPILDNDGNAITFTTTAVILTFLKGSKKEIVYATGFTQDGDGNFTLSGVVRDIPWDGSSLTGQGNPIKWTSKTTVLMSLTAYSLNDIAQLSVAQEFTAKNTFTGGYAPPTFANDTARDAAFPSPWNGLHVISGTAAQIYYNSTWNTLGTSSTPSASTTVEGTVEEATTAEVGASTATGGTGARLFINPSSVVKTSSGSGDENKIPALNANGQLAGGFTGLSSGMMMIWTTDTAPTGWLLCYGQAISRTTYSDLFAVISTTYGSGDGSATFNVPDMRGRFALGQDDMGGSSADRVTATQADNLGQASGAQSVNIDHTHTVTQDKNVSSGTGATVVQTTTTSTMSANTDPNIMNPYLTLNYIIKF